ncbi:MAG TPA: type II and III secretion system protein [Gallionellaceae bacterium]|nr:type II and III secretion system protein [Gallionellaceae bacterium]
MYFTCALLGACGTGPIAPSDKHLQQPDTTSQGNGDIPQADKRSFPLAPPKPAAKIEIYSVVVSNVPAQEILFAMARDAKINLDISAGIQGNVSLNAINQTLPQILDRISKQVDMRYELDNGTLSVMPDKPFLKTYKIDFINMSRSAKSTNSTSSQISSAGAGAGAAAATTGNSASTVVTSDTRNELMDSLVKNVTDIILEEDRLKYKSQKEISSSSRVAAQGEGAAAAYSGTPGGKGKQAGGGGESGPAGGASGAGNESIQAAGAAKSTTAEFEKSVSVFANKETGVLLARATSRQHEKIQEFIDRVMTTAKRQVLIEATIVEVKLNDQYKQGINWSRALLGAQGYAFSQAGTAGLAGTAGSLTITYLDPTSNFGNILASVTLLEKFGNVKVLSSPKLSVMNNQTASLKVADSKVYFTVQSVITLATATSSAFSTFTTTANSVSVGLTMSVTPQISDTDTVTINLRPSISRIIGYAKDPNPNLANPCGTGVATCNIPAIENLIPEIQTREMESIIKVESGQTAVMGGLIQESIDKNSAEVPFISRIPLLGNLFQNRDDTTSKTELVIFLRPLVIKDASVNGDFKEFSNNLPNADFFHEDARGAHIEP